MTHEDMLRDALIKIADQRHIIEDQQRTIDHQARTIVEWKMKERARQRAIRGVEGDEGIDGDEGMIKLHLGDCVEKLREIEDCSVDSVVTDPPYGIDFQSAWRIDREKWKPKIANDKRPFIWFLPEAFRALKPGGALLCFCRWDVQEDFRRAIELAGFDLKSHVIWDRMGHGMGDLKASFAPQHDVIWFATKGKFSFHSSRPKSVVRSPRIQGEKLVHPNEKPVDLMKSLINSVTPPPEALCLIHLWVQDLRALHVSQRGLGLLVLS